MSCSFSLNQIHFLYTHHWECCSTSYRKRSCYTSVWTELQARIVCQALTKSVVNIHILTIESRTSRSFPLQLTPVCVTQTLIQSAVEHVVTATATSITIASLIRYHRSPVCQVAPQRLLSILCTPHPLRKVIETSCGVQALLLSHWLALIFVDSHASILLSVSIVLNPHIQASIETIYTIQVRQSLSCLIQHRNVFSSLIKITLNKFLHFLTCSTLVVTSLRLCSLFCYNRNSETCNIIAIRTLWLCTISWKILILTSHIQIKQCTICVCCAKITLLDICCILWINCRNHIVCCINKLCLIVVQILCKDIITSCILILCKIAELIITSIVCCTNVTRLDVTNVHKSTITKSPIITTTEIASC